jgi:hypothetical protein
MAKFQDIDYILRKWPYQPGVISARLLQAKDGREVVQMRIDLGIIQMEATGRPDGQKPEGAATYLDYLLKEELETEGAFQLTDEQIAEIDREFFQFYHRRICWLALREFERAVGDADHTLALMDFSAKHAADEDWILSHEQYRPFVLFHRTQAAALAKLENAGPEAAIEEINNGLEQIRNVYEDVEGEEQFEDDEMVEQLRELQNWLREHYDINRTLAEQLADAVASEQYELAAQLRDEIARRGIGH